MIRKVSFIIALVLVLLLVDLGPIVAQDGKTFTGKIAEIAQGTELDIARTGTFYTIKLEEYPKIKFRLKTADAERWGVVQRGGISGVVTPKMSKGLGWRVKLSCEGTNYGDSKSPVYKVTALQRMGD